MSAELIQDSPVEPIEVDAPLTPGDTWWREFTFTHPHRADGIDLTRWTFHATLGGHEGTVDASQRAVGRLIVTFAPEATAAARRGAPFALVGTHPDGVRTFLRGTASAGGAGVPLGHVQRVGRDRMADARVSFALQPRGDKGESGNAVSQGVRTAAEAAQAGAVIARDSAAGSATSAASSAAIATSAADSAGLSATDAGAAAGAAFASAGAAGSAADRAAAARLGMDGVAADAAASKSAAGQSAFAAGSSAAAAQGSEDAARSARTGAETARAGSETALAGSEAARAGSEAARDIALAGQFLGSQPGAVNLDTLGQVGRFRFSSAQVAASTGFPFTGSAATVDISTVLNTPATIIQHVVPFSSGAPRGIYQRMVTGSGPLPWRLIPVMEVVNPTDQPGYSVGLWDSAFGGLRNLMPGGISLGTSDLNTVMLNGHYVQTSSTPSTLERGYPYAGFYGSVEVSGTGTGITRQLAMGFNNTSGVRVYVRNRNTNNTAWLPWQHLPSQTVDQTAGRVILTWDDLNNRPQRIYGDTGFRSLAPLMQNGWKLGSGGGLLIRRTDDLVTLVGYNVDGTEAANNNILSGADLPGFLPAVGSHRLPYIRDGGSTIAACVVTANTSGSIILSAGVVHGTVQFWSVSWQTTAAWPTSLPGNAQGAIPNL